MRIVNQLVVASENRGKWEEFAELGRAHDLEVVPLRNWVRNARILGRVEKSEPKTSYADNARFKCEAAFGAAKVPTFSDDTGLEVVGLDGMPGIISARYCKPNPGESQDQALRNKILRELKGKTGKDRAARFVCALVFMVEGVVMTAEGVCEGTIAEAEKGEAGFGYDSIFIPTAGDGRTLAEMTREEKNKISHRTNAFAELVRQIKEENIELVRP